MESLENEEARLCTESEVTNEMILKSFLLGVVNSNEPRVTVIKNRLNGVTGEVPFNLWASLVEDFNELKTKQNLQKEKRKNQTEENSNTELDEIFGAFGEAFEGYFDNFAEVMGDIKDEVKDEFRDNIKPKAKNTFSSMMSGLEDIAETLKPTAEKIRTEGMVKGIQTAHIAKLQARKIKLQAARQIAVSEGVATKGFIKKIDRKLAKITQVLS
jgi:hypothetical protein